MTQNDEVRAAIDEAAEAIAALPVAKWGPLVIYLLEKLDAETTQKLQFRGALDLIFDAILNRNYLGKW